MHQSTGVDRHLLFSVRTVPSIFWQRKTRSTWAYPIRYRPALACSILSMPSPLGLPCGRLALEQPRRDELETAFPCSASSTGWVRSTLYTGGAKFASGHVREPEPDHLPFWPKP